MPEAKKNKPRAIVLTRFSALGDVAMTIPPVYDLCMARPDRVVVVVTRTWMGAMMANAPSNLRVVGADLNGRHKGPLGMVRLARELAHDYDIEAFIDLHDVLRTRILRAAMRLQGVPVTIIDKGRRAKRQLVRMGADAYSREGGEPLPATIDRYRDAIDRAGYRDIRRRFTALYPPTAPDGTCRIGVAPFAAHEGKVYPLDKMAEVVRLLADRPDTTIYLFGAGPSETAILDEWAAGRPNIINMAARKAGLRAEMELMATLDTMLAMDSANMHLAAVAGTPRLVSIWGATHPAAGFTPFRPSPANGGFASGCERLREYTHTIIQTDQPCRPCSIYGNRPCRYPSPRPCLATISPTTIANIVLNRQNSH